MQLVAKSELVAQKWGWMHSKVTLEKKHVYLDRHRQVHKCLHSRTYEQEAKVADLTQPGGGVGGASGGVLPLSSYLFQPHTKTTFFFKVSEPPRQRRGAPNPVPLTTSHSVCPPPVQPHT